MVELAKPSPAVVVSVTDVAGARAAVADGRHVVVVGRDGASVGGLVGVLNAEAVSTGARVAGFIGDQSNEVDAAAIEEMIGELFGPRPAQ